MHTTLNIDSGIDDLDIDGVDICVGVVIDLDIASDIDLNVHINIIISLSVRLIPYNKLTQINFCTEFRTTKHPLNARTSTIPTKTI